MKKMIVFMFALMGAILFAAEGPVLIYDYKASVKRLDVSRQTTKISGAVLPAMEGKKVTYDSPKVVTDTITGYVVIRACDNCSGTLTDSTAPENEALVYIVSKNNKKTCYRAVGSLVSNVFGSKAGTSCTVGLGVIINQDKLSDCSVALAYPLDWGQINGKGFFGLDNMQLYDYVGDTNIKSFSNEASQFCWNEGFGKIQKKTIEDNTPCVSTNYTCFEIKTVNGQLIANTNYAGTCTDFLFSLCNEMITCNNAPVVGTFQLRLNTSMTFSGEAFKSNSYAEAEQLIIKKAGYTDIYAPANDTADDDYGVVEAKYWTDLTR